jgi:hypothetical protein
VEPIEVPASAAGLMALSNPDTWSGHSLQFKNLLAFTSCLVLNKIKTRRLI